MIAEKWVYNQWENFLPRPIFCVFLIGPSIGSLLNSTNHLHKPKKLIIFFGRHYELTYNKKPYLVKVQNHLKIRKNMYKTINSPKNKKI